MFGNEEAEARAKSIDNAMDKVEKFRRRIAGLRARLRDSRRTSFLVVTIPTTLGVLESERLIKELAFQGISVSDIVVNQCLTGKYDADLSELIATYYDRRKSGQKKWISELKETARAISGSSEFKANGNAGPIKVSEVPFFDVELVGVPALSYLSASAFTSNDAFSYLMDDKDAKGEM